MGKNIGKQRKKVMDDPLHKSISFLGLKQVRIGGLEKWVKKFNSLLRIFGVLNGKKAFTSPRFVEIILNNNCNLKCIMCVFNSPLRNKLTYKKNVQLDYTILIKLIEELADLGVEEIILNAYGEPFLYPNIIELIKLIKKKRMRCCVITNGTLINKRIIKHIFDSKLDLLRVSLWAGDPKTYVKIHPDQTSEMFYKIKRMLLDINRMKKRGYDYPKITIVNGFINKNSDNIKDMVEFAQEVGADAMEFRVAYLYKPELKKLSLSRKQKDSILSFLKNNIPHRIKPENNLIDFKKILDYNCEDWQRSDGGIPFKIPCYSGWHASLVNYDGQVYVCPSECGKPIGNIYKEPFKRIWFSAKYNAFRKLSNNPQTRKSFGCKYNCCYFKDNLRIHKKISHFMFWSKVD